jgi:hypothetical protein
MNLPCDEKRWTLGLDVIEREKAAARIWLAGRDWDSGGTVRKSPPFRRTGRSVRIVAAAAGIAVLFLGVLLLRPVFRPRSSAFLGPADSIRKVFELVQAESPDSLSVAAILNEAASSEAAWSIQRVLCAALLQDAGADGLRRLIERALEMTRGNRESPAEETGRTEPRRSNLSETILRFYRFYKEG